MFVAAALLILFISFLLALNSLRKELKKGSKKHFVKTELKKEEEIVLTDD